MKNVLVLGVAGGLGSEIAKKYLANGYNVYGLDIKENVKIADLHYFMCDITNEQSILEVRDSIAKEIDDLYAIISSVGIYYMDSLLEVEDIKLKQVLDVNVLGIYRVVKAFYSMLHKGSKILITTSELATYDPLPFNGIYSISKALLEKYAYSLRMEVNKEGIKVIVLRPGAIQTSLLNDSTSSMEAFTKKTKIHEKSATKFKHIVDSVETKALSPARVSNYIYKIVKKKHPRYHYSINRNAGLVLLNMLPQKMQVAIISKIIK